MALETGLWKGHELVIGAKGLVSEGVAEQNQRGVCHFGTQLMDAENWSDLRDKGLWP